MQQKVQVIESRAEELLGSGPIMTRAPRKERPKMSTVLFDRDETHSRLEWLLARGSQMWPYNSEETKTNRGLQSDSSEIFSISSRSLSLKTQTLRSPSKTMQLLLALAIATGAFLTVQATSGARGSAPNDGEGGSPQATRAPTGYYDRRHEASLQARQNDNEDEEGSIDRFDLGEQIRAPLMKPPTTLAPLPLQPHRQQRQQAPSRAESAQLAAAAAVSDSTYLSPEEHEQLMKSQEAHYDGAGGTGQMEEANGNGGLSGEQAQIRQTASHNNNNKQMSPGGSAASDSAQDDDDYEEGGESLALEGAQARAGPQAPESRRELAMANSRQQQLPLQNNGLDPDEPAASFANNNQDDYGGAADGADAYFARKRPATASQLNLAASINRQQNEFLLNRRQQEALANAGADQQGDGPDLPQTGQSNLLDGSGETPTGGGFGPGANEAFLADQAAQASPNGLGSAANQQLNGNSNGRQDDDDDNDNGDDEDGTSADSGAAPPTGMNDEFNEPSAGTNYTPRGQSSDGHGLDQASSSPSRDATQPASDNYAAAASSSQRGPPVARQSLGGRLSTTGQVQPAQARQQQQQQDPLRVMADRIRQQAADEWQQARLQKNPHLLFAGQPSATGGRAGSPPNVANVASVASVASVPSVQPQHQKQMRPQATTSTTQAPYNPQNNPSHAGKYFID